MDSFPLDITQYCKYLYLNPPPISAYSGTFTEQGNGYSEFDESITKTDLLHVYYFFLYINILISKIIFIHAQALMCNRNLNCLKLMNDAQKDIKYPVQQ